MLSLCSRVWFLIFDHPRCAICHRYSRPAKVFCSDDCKVKLEALDLPTADVGRSILERLSLLQRCDSAVLCANQDGAFSPSPATPHS